MNEPTVSPRRPPPGVGSTPGRRDPRRASPVGCRPRPPTRAGETIPRLRPDEPRGIHRVDAGLAEYREGHHNYRWVGARETAENADAGGIYDPTEEF